MRLSAANIKALVPPPGKKDKVFFDDTLPGFGIRAWASGSKSWHVQYDRHGRTRRLSLGSIAVLNLTQAREAARRLLAQVKLGGDPVQDKAQAKLELRERTGVLIESYLRFKSASLRPGSMREMTRHLRRYAQPLHATPIVELDRRRIAVLLGSLAENSGPAAANHCRASLRSFLGWCVGSGYLEHNPATYTPQQPQRPRQRVPSLEELRIIWSVLGADAYGEIVRLLMLLGLRRAEVGDLSWSEVDFEAAVLVLPAGRVKGKRQHTVPLTEGALAILKRQPRRNRDKIFGYSSKGHGFGGWGDGKRRLDAKLRAAGHHVKASGAARPPKRIGDAHERSAARALRGDRGHSRACRGGRARHL